MDKEPKKKIVKQLRHTDKLKSEVGDLEYPVDILEDLYTRSRWSLKRISKKYNISLKMLQDYSEYFFWDEQRSKQEKITIDMIVADRTESFVKELTFVQKLQRLKQLQEHDEIEGIEEHFEKYGHLFCVKDPGTGELYRDAVSGLPLKLNILPSKYEIVQKKELMGLIEGAIKLLEESRVRAPEISPKEPPKAIEGKASAKAYLEEEND